MAIRTTNDFLYAVGQIAYKVRRSNRAGMVTIQKFILDLLVLVRVKTKSDKDKEKVSRKNRGQLKLDGVKNIVEDYLTVLHVTLMGPVVRRTNRFDIMQNMIFDRTSYGTFLIQPPDPDESGERISYHFVREMCIKAAIGKNGYYSNNIFVVGTHSKLYIQFNGASNKMEECGPTTKDMWLAFNRKRVSKGHMNIKISLALGYKQKKTTSATQDEYCQNDKMEEPKKLELKNSSAQRAASQYVNSGVAKFMETLNLTKESPCYHGFSEEMYQTGLIYYAVEEYSGK